MLIEAGRVALGGMFVAAGIIHFFRFAAVSQRLAASGIPFPRFVLLAGSLLQIAAGGALALGLCVRPAALGLVVFTIAATLMVLRFWTMPHGPERHMIFNAALINVGLIGGLLIAAA